MEDDLCRDDALQALKMIVGAINEGLRCNGVAIEEGEPSRIANRALYAFKELAERFIEPHARTNPALAAHGFKMLGLLIEESFNAGLYGVSSVRGFTERERHRARSSAGGKGSGESSRKRQAERWSGKALSLAIEYVASNPKYSQDDLASHIKFMLDDLAPTHGQIKAVISVWQKSALIPRPNRKIR